MVGDGNIIIGIGVEIVGGGGGGGVSSRDEMEV
jgi:hypothetical protein